MTQYRNDPAKASNYFDVLYQGVGKRGSSFTDLDMLTHDADSGRFLVQEFKYGAERLSNGQLRALLALAALPQFSVWFIRRVDPWIQWQNLAENLPPERITPNELRRRFASWWAQDACISCGPVRAEEMVWSRK